MKGMRRIKGIPVLLAEPYRARDGSFHMKAWCPMCANYHYHGGIDQTSRASHCSEGPYKQSGYYLKIDMDKPENIEILKAYKKAKV